MPKIPRTPFAEALRERLRVDAEVQHEARHPEIPPAPKKRGRPPKRQDDEDFGPRNTFLIFRVTEEERDALKAVSRAVGMSMSGVFRQILSKILLSGKSAEEIQQALFEGALTIGGVKIKKESIPRVDVVKRSIERESKVNDSIDDVDFINDDDESFVVVGELD